MQIAKEIGWPLEPSRSGFLPDSVQRWRPFKETSPPLEKLGKKIEPRTDLQHRRQAPGARPAATSRTDFDLVVTAQQVRSYKPDPAHFKECERRMGGKSGWVHVAASYYHDVEPCLKLKVPVVWVNRHGEELEQGQKKPTAEVANLREAAKLLLGG